MIDFIFYVAISLVLILEVTKAYKKSYSTTLIVVFTPLIVWLNKENYDDISSIITISIASILLIRAIINKNKDKFIKVK
jgi:hypothetical protein